SPRGGTEKPFRSVRESGRPDQSPARRELRYFTFPPGTLPSPSNRCTSEAISFFQSPSCRLSFGAWALLAGSSIPSNRAGAPPNNSAKGPTNPIVPSQPMASGSLSNPFRSAPIAASNAGPFGSVIHHLTGAVTSLITTSTPQGGLAVRCAFRSWSTSAGSWSGTIRQLTTAWAVGNTWLDAPLIELASWAITVTAGRRHVCSYGVSPFSIVS